MNNKTNILFSLLILTTLSLMIMNIGLFIRINQWQNETSRSQEDNQGLKLRPTNEGLAIGTQLPNFTLTDTNGENVSLTDYRGQRLLMVFISTTCSVCQQLEPDLQSFIRTHSEESILVLAVGNQEDCEQLSDYLNTKVLMNIDNLYDLYDIPGVPWSYLIDENGIIIARGSPHSQAELEALTESN
jgi:glutathione peroxidase-family protein